MRIGLMGGTFDPIHLGHLRAAESARESLGLDEVTFVPAGIPPHRPEPASAPLDRFAMVSLATAGHPSFVASDVELRREGVSYTVDTVAEVLAARPGAEVFVIVGTDTFPEMATWKEPERLFALCSVAVVPRPANGGDPPDTPAGFAPRVTRVEGPGLPISATSIRRLVREGKSVRYMVPEAVADYIAKRGLYR